MRRDQRKCRHFLTVFAFQHRWRLTDLLYNTRYRISPSKFSPRISANPLTSLHFLVIPTAQIR
jgi:hypothetical protein